MFNWKMHPQKAVNSLTPRHLLSLTTIVLIFLSFRAAHGQQLSCEQIIPKSENYQFIKIILQQNASPFDKLNQLNVACDELDLSKNEILRSARKEKKRVESNPSLRERFQDTLQDFTTDTLLTGIETDPSVQRLIIELEKFRKISDPLARIQLIYDLVVRKQGRYMPFQIRDRLQEVSVNRIVDTLRRAETTGQGGVCRDFAVLLVWSLNRANQDEKGNTLFLARLEELYTHLIVTVATDQGEFSLDTTTYPTFSPLPVPDLTLRPQDLRKRATLCRQIADCYAEQIGPQPLSTIEVSAQQEGR